MGPKGLILNIKGRQYYLDCSDLLLALSGLLVSIHVLEVWTLIEHVIEHVGFIVN